ncbi:MAG: carbonic anhydrase, partial [Methanobacteriota archaeon]
MVEELLSGNEEFSKGILQVSGEQLKEQRENTVEGQTPKVLVVTCSDSRVVPEFLFNKGIGEIFVIRTAGERVDDVALGSIEYGIEHLNIKEVVVLGHESCGAVKGAFSNIEGDTPLAKLLNEIKDVIVAKGFTENEIEKAVEENVKDVIRKIR